jgi:hypothetical protein
MKILLFVLIILILVGKNLDMDSLENSEKMSLKTMGFCLNSLSLGED